MNDRPPVYDPNARRRPMNVVGKIVVGICLAFGLVFVGMFILMCIALNSYGSNK